LFIDDEQGIREDDVYRAARAASFQSEIRKLLGKLKSAKILPLIGSLMLDTVSCIAHNSRNCKLVQDLLLQHYSCG
jgi:hypothetical protein